MILKKFCNFEIFEYETIITNRKNVEAESKVNSLS